MGFETTFIKETITKTPFVDTPAQNFFANWCEINDSIVPQFIDRNSWEQRGVQGILEKNHQGKQTLFLPTDLHLWEMIDVIRTLDHDTLSRKPEKKDERANKIYQLGIIFEKAGLYLSEYLPSLEEKNGKQIAQDIAREFYPYGLSLQNKEKTGDQIPGTQPLSNQDKATLDEWFLGKEVYQKRLATSLGKNPTEDQKEEARKKILSAYFRYLAREGSKTGSEKPWEAKVGPMQYLQDRTKRQTEKAIETPERELNTSIFRRGVEKLITKMNTPNWREAINTFIKQGCSLDLATEKVKLYNTLHLDDLKQELAEARSTGDLTQISAKELEIAKKIQKAVSSFTYDESSSNPSEMVETQFINCVGSSILGGGLLDEVGIKYLHANLPEHAVTVLITSDGKAYWQDFTPGSEKLYGNYAEISPDMFENGTFTENPSDSGISLAFKEFNPYRHVPGQLRISLFSPEIGLQCTILNNIGADLNILGRDEEAIDAYQQAINIDPKYAYPYYGLGFSLHMLGRYEEAIDAYQQAINIDPKYDTAYYSLGFIYAKLGRNEEAIKILEQHKELVNNPENEWVKIATEKILELKQK